MKNKRILMRFLLFFIIITISLFEIYQNNKKDVFANNVKFTLGKECLVDEK